MPSKLPGAFLRTPVRQAKSRLRRLPTHLPAAEEVVQDDHIGVIRPHAVQAERVRPKVHLGQDAHVPRVLLLRERQQQEVLSNTPNARVAYSLDHALQTLPAARTSTQAALPLIQMHA